MYENIKDKLFKCFNKLVQRKSISLAKIFSLFNLDNGGTLVISYISYILNLYTSKFI